MDDIAHGQLHDFAADGPGNVADLDDLRRHVPRGGVLPDKLADLIPQRIVQHDAFRSHKQHHALVVPVLVHAHAFQHWSSFSTWR
jgi:hypothetical protein